MFSLSSHLPLWFFFPFPPRLFPPHLFSLLLVFVFCLFVYFLHPLWMPLLRDLLKLTPSSLSVPLIYSALLCRPPSTVRSILAPPTAFHWSYLLPILVSVFDKHTISLSFDPCCPPSVHLFFGFLVFFAFIFLVFFGFCFFFPCYLFLILYFMLLCCL